MDKKTISLIICIITAASGIGGASMYSNAESYEETQLIIQTMEAEITSSLNSHKAEASPHIGDSIKFENLDKNVENNKQSLIRLDDKFDKFEDKLEDKFDRLFILLCNNPDFNCT